jgi:dTDP-4-dehydrorhamnose reductase
MNLSKVLVTGGKGMLANDLIYFLKKENFEVFSVDIEELDITNEKSVHEFINKTKPELIINSAAYTAVDKCESEPISEKVNGDSLKYLSEAASINHSKLIHFSTDYIFSGEYTKPILETEKTNPINAYGRGKLIGEENILNTKNFSYTIFRVQWLYGKNGKNFVDTMLKLSETKKEISVVSDQIGRPTSTKFLAELIVKTIPLNLNGIFHLGPKDECSWFEFASYILKDKDIKINPIPSSSYPTPAKRPLYSVLGLEKIQSVLKDKILEKTWKELVDEYLERL